MSYVRPDISVLMPVCAWPDPNDMNGEPHPQLIRALDSIVEGSIPEVPSELSPGVEIFVGIDGEASKLSEFIYDWWNSTVRKVGTRHLNIVVSTFTKAAEITWGNRQRNEMLDLQPSGRLIVWQDQDDRFFRGALSRIVKEAGLHPGQPLICKMQMCQRTDPSSMVLWQTKGRVERDHIGGHMLVVPNEPGLIGRWEPETSYSADFDFIKTTLDRFSAAGHEAFWSEEFISMLRPHVMGI